MTGGALSIRICSLVCLALSAAACTYRPVNSIRRLSWIEGAWRGTGAEQPFFECYRLIDDSTLYVTSFGDSTFSAVDDTTVFALRGGVLANAGPSVRWSAVAFANDSVLFRPLKGARNSFTWRRRSSDLWEAWLDWPATDSSPRRERLYRMGRVPSGERQHTLCMPS
jgi:hypothetical protein